MIPAILTAIVPALGTLVDRLIPDKAAAERAGLAGVMAKDALPRQEP